MPLHPETTVSVAWFFEANYYTVANASYLQPLLGDIGEISKRRDNRAADEIKPLLTRRALYKNFESLLEKHGFPSVCLLRAICENASTHFLHNGLLGDVLYLILTPSTSMEEQDLEDYYYEAEYLGLEDECYHYEDDCPDSPLDFISLKIKP